MSTEKLPAQSEAELGQQQRRRSSLFGRLGDKLSSKKAQSVSDPVTGPSSDDASTFSGETITSRTGFFRRESNVDPATGKKVRRERICDNGPFKVVVDPVTNVARLVENNRWPPGVEYETPNRYTKNQGLNQWYTNRGPIVGGGDPIANAGPDPDWIPGLSKAEREEIKKKNGGWYVF